MPETQLAVLNQNNALAIEAALVQGDLAKLSTAQRIDYFNQVCKSLGLNPLTKPFGYHEFDGKTVLYARKDATEQLRKIHGVSITKLENEIKEGLVIYTAYVTDRTGRTDVGTGAVSIEGEKGKNRANAIMKAETKAKRRATLSLCGLGILDESELDGLPEVSNVTSLETKALPEAITAPSAVNSAPATEGRSVSEQVYAAKVQQGVNALVDVVSDIALAFPAEHSLQTPAVAQGGLQANDPAPHASLPSAADLDAVEAEKQVVATTARPEVMAGSDKPNDLAYLTYKSRASNLRAELEKHGFKASPGFPSGKKLVKYFTTTAGVQELAELTISQWETVFSVLDNLVKTDPKRAVEVIEEKIR